MEEDKTGSEIVFSEDAKSRKVGENRGDSSEKKQIQRLGKEEARSWRASWCNRLHIIPNS